LADLLPPAFPKTLAAAIAGCDIKTFRNRVIDPGLVELDDCGRVLRMSLEKHLGYQITPERFLAADRRLDVTSRAWQQRYRDARQGAAHVA
jgi:hypothetical protein